MPNRIEGTVEYTKTLSVQQSEVENMRLLFIKQESTDSDLHSYYVAISNLSQFKGTPSSEFKETIIYWDISDILNETFFTVEAFWDDTCIFCGGSVNRTVSDMYVIPYESIEAVETGDTISETLLRATSFLCHDCASAFQTEVEERIPPEIAVSLRI